MRQSIATKYLGPTNHRGSRVKATSASGHSLTLSWDDALNQEDNHKAAARALISKLGWDTGPHGWFGGGDAAGGYVFVQAVSYAKL